MNSLLSKDVVKEWGLTTFSTEKQKDIIERLGKMLYQAILVRSLDILSETEQTELDLLLDENSTTPKEVLNFLHSKIPTFQELVSEERRALKEDLFIPTT